MSDSPPEEAPVYHKSLTPESPRPLHVPSPANIPILENQIEPIFNLISSHIEPPYAARDLTQMDQDLGASLAAADGTLNAEVPVQSLDSAEVQPVIEDTALPADVDEETSAVQTSDTVPPASADQEPTDDSANAAALNNDEQIAAITNSSSHAANLSIASEAEHQTSETVLPPVSSASAQDTSTAQADVPSLEQYLITSQNVADDGMQALLESLNAPRNVQADLAASAPAVSEAPAVSGINATPQAVEKVEPSNEAVSEQTAAQSQIAVSEQPVANSVANQTNSGGIISQDAQNGNRIPHALPPPPGLISNSLPGMNGIAPLQMGINPQNAGAPGVAALPAAPGTNDQQAASVNGSTDARYSSFLDEESVFTAEGAWEKFPHGSRLFVGNLPTEAVTKREIWNIFEKYGKLAQISIKQAYGFVQFMDVEACQKAMKHEQGARIKERNMHLEVSKPPKSSRNTQTSADADRLRDRHRRNRSRSPDRKRGQRGGQGRNLPYSDFRDEPRRGRDDYRPGRSPSPRRRVDDYRPGRDRSPDRYYDGRRRSRSPYNRQRRSPSPRRTGDDDDLPLPRRSPRDVPDVQIILLEDVSPPFIDFVVRGFRDEGIRVDVLNMPRVSLEAVVKRQIVEGVLAVCRLTRNEERTGKVPLQVFDRSQGSQNVRFDEYDNLEMPIAAKLAARAKSTAVPPTPTYSNSSGAYVPPYMQQQAQTPQPPALANNPQLQQLITTLDGPALQQLLSAMGQQQGTPTQPGFPQQSIPGQPDMSAMLSNMQPHQQQQQQHASQQASPQAYSYQQQSPHSATQQTQYGYPANTYQGQQTTAGYPAQAYGQPPQDPSQVQSIMQQLAGIQRKS